MDEAGFVSALAGLLSDPMYSAEIVTNPPRVRFIPTNPSSSKNRPRKVRSRSRSSITTGMKC